MLNVRPYTPALQKLAAKFDCGNSYLNQFLRSPDALDAGVGKTFVFLTENAESIVGYYNLSCGSLDEIEGDVRYKIGGTIHIGYFAIDEKFQHLKVIITGGNGTQTLLPLEPFSEAVSGSAAQTGGGN